MRFQSALRAKLPLWEELEHICCKCIIFLMFYALQKLPWLEVLCCFQAWCLWRFVLMKKKPDFFWSRDITKCHLKTSFRLRSICETLCMSAQTTDLSEVSNTGCQQVIKLVRTCVFPTCSLKHIETQVCFVSSACGVTVSYRLIKAIHHFT